MIRDLCPGFGDNVKCFYCDGGLRNWEPGDDPWVEHARWFPRCSFVRTVKGDQFIRSIQDQFSQSNNTPGKLLHNVTTANCVSLYSIHIHSVFFYQYNSQCTILSFESNADIFFIINILLISDFT